MTSQRLTLPEPEIELYKDGFDAKEKGVTDLGRKEDGKKLSDLVERITDPMVIAVDAPWGAGKSVFLKCWVGEHIKPEYKRNTTTVYFDAFQHDFLDDPLIALTGVISERFEVENSQAGKWDKIKETAYRLRKPAARIGAAAITGGVSELTAPVIDAVLDATTAEFAKASEAFWEKEDGKRAAMQGFRDALENLAADQKLVIIVDELDRCRPDYALNLLEVIKHFFNVENVHFILGVNLTELENSVRARYGAGVNASKYLQKFYNVRMPLALKTPVNSEEGSLYAYFEAQSDRLGLDHTQYRYALGIYFQAFSNIPNFSLRDTNAILTATMLALSLPKSDGDISECLSAGLIALRILDPKLYQTLGDRLFDGKEVSERILTSFGLIDMPSALENSDIHKLRSIWNWALAGINKPPPPEKALRQKGVKGYIPQNGRTHLRQLMRERVNVFEFSSDD
ncbi:KAP family P-loop NTPase fold protein [Celeribacter sp.]|uniref:KAP family P-loop NTPase fold protein n=1 Tax=Celeribacter sp. TaxID=1890673 RepID=UPI003A959C1A